MKKKSLKKSCACFLFVCLLVFFNRKNGGGPNQNFLKCVEPTHKKNKNTQKTYCVPLTPSHQCSLQHISSYLRAQHPHQLEVQVHCFSSRPCKEHQHEVLQQSSTDATENREGSQEASGQEEHIDTKQRHTQVYEDQAVFLLTQGSVNKFKFLTGHIRHRYENSPGCGVGNYHNHQTDA